MYLKTKKESISLKSENAKNDFFPENELREKPDQTKEAREQIVRTDRKKEASKLLFLERYE